MEMEEYCMAGRVHIAVDTTALPTRVLWLCTCCRALAGMTMKDSNVTLAERMESLPIFCLHHFNDFYDASCSKTV